MKKTITLTFLILSTASFYAQAGLWEDTKDAVSSAWETTKEVTSDTASSAWEATKETSKDIKDGAVEKWNEATSSDKEAREDDQGIMSDIKKLGEKETYTNTWEDIKHSAKNPEAPKVDEHGIPKQ